MLCIPATLSITISGDVYKWVETTESQIPPNALVAGHDNFSKENVYIGNPHCYSILVYFAIHQVNNCYTLIA